MKSLFVALLLSLCTVWTARAQTVQPLKVGVLPTLSTKTLLTNYEPLRQYLERELHHPVILLTSVSFSRFHHDTLAGDFDLAVTAPHLARVAQLDAGFLPIATYLSANRAVLITAKHPPVKDFDELRGRSLAIFDPLALVVLQTQDWLEDRGLQSGRDYRSVVYPSQNSVGFSVIQNESLIGVTSPAGLRQYPAELLDKIQVFAELPRAPALIWVVHPQRSREADRFKAALLRFADTPEGAQFYGGNAYKGMRAVTADELRLLDRPARGVKRLIQVQP
ncbi:MAG: phosphate/phosphite/phosphonate ABC transporter substrate-binding protein [Thiobacillus sp.]|nr:phosphate/phosphite/phosphonate ABC transporter substrate-binding protein [Thiobacillus sp.]